FWRTVPLPWELPLQHTLEPLRRRIQLLQRIRTVIQLVTARLELCAKSSSLDGSCHPAATLDRMADATDLVAFPLGDCPFQQCQPFVQITHHRIIDLPDS